MFKHGFPPEWSTFKKLIWLVGSGIAGDASGIWKTVTGTLIHITNALASPMQKCEVSLEPIQDLHGQDAPYPAGGGKNKWNTQPYVGTTVGYNSAEGTEASFTEGSGATVSGNSISYSIGAWQGFFFKTSPLPAGIYHLHVDLSAITNARVSIYTVGSDNKIGVPSNYTVSAAIDSNRNVEEGGYVAIYIGSNTAQTITFSNYQIESGSAYTSWSPFANICPITGRTGCEVWVKPEYDTSLPATASVTFPDTVYGGKYDFVSGVGESALAKLNFDGTETGWTRDSGTQISDGTYRFSRAITASSNTNANYPPAELNSNYLKPDGSGPLYYGNSGSNNCAVTNNKLFVRILGVTTLEELSTYLSANPLQIVYPLAEPTEIQLTPQPISTLKGVNNVWSNSNGETTLIYKAQSS